MNKEMSNRIKVLGFLMTCVIAVYHCGSPKTPINAFDTKWNTFIGEAIDSLAILAMSYFFTVTGFLLFHGLSLKNYYIKIKKRLYSLILPYLIWQIIIVIKMRVQGGQIWPFSLLIGRIFFMKGYPPNGALWYLYAIFILALLSPIFLLLFRRKGGGWLWVTILIIAVYRLSFLSNSKVVSFRSYGYVGNILMYFPSYIIGAYYGMHANESLKELRHIVAILFTAMIFEALYDGFLYDLTIKVMPVFLLYFFPVLPCMRERKVYKLSFLVYAVHHPISGDVIKHLQNLTFHIIPYAFIGNIIIRIICLAIVFSVAAIIYYLCKKFAPKMLKVLTGGRA